MLKRAVFSAVLALSMNVVQAGGLLPPVQIYGPDPCLSCMEWAYHMMQNGFSVTFKATADMAAVKRRFKVPRKVESVLTAQVGPYFIEGHVPADDIKQFLKEKPKARGLAVPDLPLGAPGYEGIDQSCEAGCVIVDKDSERELQREMYKVFLVGKDGKTSVYARH